MHDRDKIYFHNFLTGMRTGKDITLEQLSLGLCTPAMLSLIEADKRQPDKLTRDRLTERLGFENDGFEDFLQPDEYEQWQNRDRLLRAVDAGDIPEAERLLELLEQEMAEDSIVFRQFVLTMRAQLMQYKEASREELRETFGRAMSLTVPDVASGTWAGRLLAAQEWNLLLEYIRHGGDAGPVTEPEPSGTYTARALEKLLDALRGSSMDGYSYAKVYPKAAYFLCLELMKAPLDSALCRRILRISAEAVEILRSCQRMYWLYELLELMERVLGLLAGLVQPGPKEPAPVSFDRVWNQLGGTAAKPQSPAGTAASGPERPEAWTLSEDSESLALLTAQIREWRMLLAEIYQEYGIPMNMENCCYLYSQTQNYCIGDVIRKRRRMLSLSVRELCEGICSEKTLRRLENNKTKSQRAVWSELFCRLGLSPEYQRESVVTGQRDVLLMYRASGDTLNNHDTEETQRLLEQLKKLLPMDIPINRQELERKDCLNKLQKKEITAEECVIRLKKALQYTIPLESIKMAKDGPDIYLTCTELGCIYNTAMKSKDEAEEFNLDLLQSVTRQCIPDDSIDTFINMYELIMSGVASRLGSAGEYNKSTEISEKAMKKCLSARRMGTLHQFLYNRLWNRIESAKKSTSTALEIPITQELWKCIQLTNFCKETFHEKFYINKLNYFFN